MIADSVASVAAVTGASSAPAPKDLKTVPSENRDVKKHWHKVVMHQGWLLKQGGVGVGTNKQWIKRYFVLYKTSQGHFLVYYSDFTECPMYTAEKHHRNIIDLSKTTFIRPGSNKAEQAANAGSEIPPYCFDIVTTEREWTLCAESQENVQKWLKLMTRAVDEDVAILPDEELIFKVKPKLDPLQVLPATDYSTSLRVSANGISVCIPDPLSKDGAEKEVYFWVYTDFYKWSLICPDGKLALLVNVFADSSFSRRYEYVFRNKEASRLATAIEYFIEKFMSVMHLRLETSPEGLDDTNDNQGGNTNVVTGTVVGNNKQAKTGGMHELDAEDLLSQGANYGGNSAGEIDLLGLDIEPLSIGGSNGHSAVVSHSINSDPFDSDPFGSSPAPPPPRTTAPPPPPASSNALDLFGNDDPFASDPFGSGGFGAPSTAVSVNRVAPPLSESQLAQHKAWFLAALAANGGALYDDGTLRVSCKIEVKLSQSRLTLSFSNTASNGGAINDLVATISDTEGFTVFDVQHPLTPSTLPAGVNGSGSQIVRLECMKPVNASPSLELVYTDPVHGKRSNKITLPIILNSFVEGLSMPGNDFMSRWNALTAPGLEVQQVIRPTTTKVVPQNITNAMTSVSVSLLFFPVLRPN